MEEKEGGNDIITLLSQKQKQNDIQKGYKRLFALLGDEGEEQQCYMHPAGTAVMPGGQH